MNKIKIVEKIVTPPPTHWVGDGFKVHNFFPGGLRDEKRMSPFFLLDYNAKMEFPPSEKQRGVGPHPHKGFETVTIAFKGKVAHHDSKGNSGVIGEGDIQWMTAGSGILHKEYHEEEFSKKGGEFQMAQIWVNLPSKYKLTEPKYQAIENNQLERFRLKDKAEIEVIAGNYKGVKGTASTFSPIEMYNCHLKEGASVDFSLPENFNTGILMLEGRININDTHTLDADNFCLFKNEGTDIKIRTLKNAVFLLMSGEPIDEPIASYGPFLMNTSEEIRQAIFEFQNGEYGTLE